MTAGINSNGPKIQTKPQGPQKPNEEDAAKATKANEAVNAQKNEETTKGLSNKKGGFIG